jgi:putative ABC transport system substrate-binding protein
MNRREALGLLIGGTACARAAAQVRLMRVGVVFYRVPQADLTGPKLFFLAEVLRAGLRDLGWTENRNIEFMWRSAESRDERIAPILRQLLDAGADVLALSGNNIIEAAMRLTSTVPIVMLGSTSPLESGLVRSLSRPGGNVTGVTLNSQPELAGKRLEILKEAAPGIARVAVLHDGLTRENAIEAVRDQAARVGLDAVFHAVDNSPQLHESMRRVVAMRAQAISVETSFATAPSMHPEIRSIVERYRLPMIHRFREAVASGHALMSYAPDPLDDYRRACVIIDRILRGARPGDIPVEATNRFYLDVNLKLAESIGWKIPASVISRADTVIR